MTLLHSLLAPLLLAAGAFCEPMGWPTGSVKHRFLDTPNGQLHYVVGGRVSQLFGTTLVLLHSHPRSTTEFKYFTRDLDGRFPFVAVDYFGMGLSEDYLGANASDQFCTVEAYAAYILKILDKEWVHRFAVMGNLKGAHNAAEVAAQARPGRVAAVVYVNTIILDAKAKDFIEHVFVPMEQKVQLHANGSQLLDAWNDPSAAAMGPDGKPSSEARDLHANEEKVVDELRCLSTGWQYSAAWAAYTEVQPARMAKADANTRSLVLFGQSALDQFKTFGLDSKHTFDVLDQALTHGHNATRIVPEAGQGMIIQNSTLLAHMVTEFLGSQADAVVV